jgi:ComF family protein
VSIFNSALCTRCFDDIVEYINPWEPYPPLKALKGMRFTPPFSTLLAPFSYHHPIDSLIKELKFNQALTCAPILASLLIPTLQQYYKNKVMPPVIIPIPLHRDRLCERGFNQSIEIARPLAKHFSLRLQTQTILRIKNTQAQARLSQSARRANIVNAFEINADLPESVILFDDVITTGHTLVQVCRQLQAHGVKDIHCWCVARS